MKIQDGILKRWFAAAITLTIVTVALVHFRDDPASNVREAVEIAFVITCALTVIGFYFVMFFEAIQKSRGPSKSVLVVFFLLFPIGSGLIYFWWTRYIHFGVSDQLDK